MILREEVSRRAPLLRAVRSAGRFVESGHLRRCRHDLQHSRSTTGAVERRRIRCCRPERGRWPPATCCTGRPPCSCSPSARASTCSCSTPASAPSCAWSENLRIPSGNKTYSVNEGNRKSFPAGYQRYLDWAQGNGYSSRYAGAMVADVHRILLKGGVFLYPPTAKVAGRKAAPDVRSQPHGHDHRTGRRQGLRGTRPARCWRSSPPRSTSARRSSSALPIRST